MFYSSNYTITERIFWMAYVIDPSKTTFQHENQVPDLLSQMIPLFFVAIVLEDFVRYMKGMERIRLNSGVSSLFHGMLMVFFKIAVKRVEFYAYSWLYQYRLVNLDWRSIWTWCAAAIGVDFCYYWMHRMSHEINFLWAFGHQIHHSSEEYNLTVATRLPALHRLFAAIFYYPLALLGVPLPACLTHIHFSLIYQFWIHTEVVSNLGPLEWILNTPSHHRVHHGINNWCLDKNYGSTLIIWDRMFGTFQEELPDEKIVYGLISQPMTFEPIYLQTFYITYVLRKALSLDSFSNFLKGILYGPGWSPGQKRLEPDIDSDKERLKRTRHDPMISGFMKCYILVQLAMLAPVYQTFLSQFKTYDWINALIVLAYLLGSVHNLGILLDDSKWAPNLELLRCTFGIIFLIKYISTSFIAIDFFLIATTTVSSLYWMYSIYRTNRYE